MIAGSASRFRRLRRKRCVQLYQGGGNIVKQARPAGFSKSAACDQHIIHADAGLRQQNSTGGFAHAPLGPIADHGIAELARGRKADPAKGCIAAQAGLKADNAAAGPGTLACLQEISPLAQMEIGRARRGR